MPTRTFVCSRDQSIADISAGNAGNGSDDHCPVGKGSYNTSMTFRSLLRFTHDWSGMYQVTKIQLKFKLTSSTHTAQGSSRRMKMNRLDASFSEGGGAENSWTTTASGDVYPGPATQGYTGDWSLTGYGEGDWVTLDVTTPYAEFVPDYVLGPDGQPGGDVTNNGVRIHSYDPTTTSRSFEFYGRRSGYEPYVVVTYTTVPPNSAPATPAITSPNGTTIAVGSNPLFSWTGTDPDSGDTLGGYDLQVDNNADFLSLHYSGVGLTAGTISGFNVTNAPYAGTALAQGTTYYWRVRNKDAAGLYSGWSSAGSFVMGAVPTVTGQDPANATLADVWNLDDAALWNGTGQFAKPIVSFVYGHPGGKSMKAYRLRVYNASSVVVYDSGAAGTALSKVNGATVVLNVNYAVIYGTTYKWGVEVQDVDGNWSAAMALSDFRVRWAQEVYSQNVGVNAQNLNAVPGTVAGGRISMCFQAANDAAGTGGVGWVQDVGTLAPTTMAWVRTCVRLLTTVAGTNATLSDLTLTYAGAASAPDKWNMAGAGATLSLDSSQRRFGYYSAKMTAPTAGTAVYIYPWRKVSTDGVSVTQNTDYVFSMYVKTNGALGGTGSVNLMVRGGSYTGTPYTPYANPPGTAYLTADSSAAPDGWQRLMLAFHVPTGVTQVWPTVWFRPGVNNQSIWVDGGKLEEGSVASLWTPGFLGASITLDAMGFSVDAKEGGIFRLRGTAGTARDSVELGANGLVFGGDSELYSPQANVLGTVGGTEFVGNSPKATGGQFRTIGGGYGMMLRHDGSNFYFLLTASGDPYGTWNAFRPISIANATGVVSLGTGATVAGVPISVNTHTHTAADLIGASTRVLGTNVAAPAVNSITHFFHGAPSAGQDPSGFYQAANGRLKIPAGLGGIYAYDVWMTGTAPVGTASSAGAYAVAHANFALPTTGPETLGAWNRFDSSAAQGMHGTFIKPMVAGEEVWTSCHMRIVDGLNVRVSGWSLYRIGT